MNANQYHQNRYAALLESAVFPGCTWLDIGAGTRIHGGWLGTSQADLAQRARRFVGCDPHLEHLFQNPYLTERIGCEAEDIPFPDASFDLVTANMTLEHLANPETVFRQVARVLTPGGYFVFLTPNKTHPIVTVARWTTNAQWRRKFNRLFDRRPPEHVFPTFYRANTVTDLRRLAQSAGMLPGKLERFSSFPFTLRIPVLHYLEEAFIAVAPEWFRSNLLGVMVNLPKPASFSGGAVLVA